MERSGGGSSKGKNVGGGDGVFFNKKRRREVKEQHPLEGRKTPRYQKKRGTREEGNELWGVTNWGRGAMISRGKCLIGPIGEDQKKRRKKRR